MARTKYRYVQFKIPNNPDTINFFMNLLEEYTLCGTFEIYHLKDCTKFNCIFLLKKWIEFQSKCLDWTATRETNRFQ